MLLKVAKIIKIFIFIAVAHCGVINSIGDESITASSVYGNYHGYGTRHSRLNTRSGDGGWLAHPPYEGENN